MNRRLLISLFAVIALTLSAIAAEPPKTVLKITVRHAGADPKTFAGQPKVMYRSEYAFGRIEEAPDPAEGIHALIIVHEPNIWMLNLADHTGRHLVDTQPPTTLHIPIFGGEERTEVSELEFGHELEFMSKKGIKPTEVTVDGKKLDRYKLKIGSNNITLLMDGKTPVRISNQGDTHFEGVEYLEFAEVPFDEKLFAKPEGFKLEEAK